MVQNIYPPLPTRGSVTSPKSSRRKPVLFGNLSLLERCFDSHRIAHVQINRSASLARGWDASTSPIPWHQDRAENT